MTKDEAKDLKPGAILQIVPTSGTDTAGRIGVHAESFAWGAKLWLAPRGQAPDGLFTVAWSNLEDTGGRAKFDYTGLAYPATAPEPMRHHP